MPVAFEFVKKNDEPSLKSSLGWDSPAPFVFEDSIERTDWHIRRARDGLQLFVEIFEHSINTRSHFKFYFLAFLTVFFAARTIEAYFFVVLFIPVPLF